MPKLKVLSAKEVIAILESLGFECVAQKGSHMKFRHGRGFCVAITCVIMIAYGDYRCRYA